jgi:lysyl-tRNA synthetase class 2
MRDTTADSPSLDQDWRPTASPAVLRVRAELLTRTRGFFHNLGYWEVETPLLSADVAIDAHIDPFSCAYVPSSDSRAQPRRMFLQTSPEFAMKRLLAAGADAIYQIARAFRNGERGGRHNPECTLIEWYRRGMHYHDLMTEVGRYVSAMLGITEPERITYREWFYRATDVDPLTASDEQLFALAAAHGCDRETERDDVLNSLLAAVVEPKLPVGSAVLVYDFPATQAALSRIRKGSPDVAERFELYVDGIELANGYQELTDPEELRRRCQRQNRRRRHRGQEEFPIESRLLAAMDAGLPECAGVALGFDRLVMLAARAGAIDEVIAFPIERA